MKKLFVMLCAAVALFACQKVQPVTVEVTPEELPSTPMTFNLTVSQAEAGATKALKSGWEDGDVIYVFFRGIGKKYLKLSHNGMAWTQTECNTDAGGAAFDESDFRGLYWNTMTAVYIPHYAVTVDYDSQQDVFTLTDEDGEPIYTYYMAAWNVDYTLDGKTVSGTLTMGKPYDFVQFYVPGIDPAEAPLYRLREEHLRPHALMGVGEERGASAGCLYYGNSLKGFPYKGGVLFAGELTGAGTATDYAFQLVKYVSATKACAEGTYEIKGRKTIDEGVVLRFPALTAWTYGKWVDMGPAGRWATGNLTDDGGTTKGEANIVAPDEAGKYYAWGETVGYAPNGSGESPPSRRGS